MIRTIIAVGSTKGEQCGYDVVPVFDQQQPVPWALVKFRLVYLSFPPPNEQWLEVYVVNPSYMVTAELLPDTVAHDSLAEIRVGVAAPCAGPYPDTTVTFTASITSGSLWGSLVNPLTHDTSTSVSGIPRYTGTPHLYFVANGANPDSTAVVRLHFTASTSDVLPWDTVIVILGKKLEVAVDTPQVRPRGTGGVDTTAVTVKATGGGSPHFGFPVHLAARGVDSSGGHYHTVGRPGGVFGDSNGITDSNGVYRTTFFANWFGGQEWIVASSSQIEQRDSVLMTIRVPGLDSLATSPYYVKVGAQGDWDPCHTSTSRHYNNHYGVPSILTAIDSIARKYYSAHNSVRIRVNDVSLVYGGLFDYQNGWVADHAEHRDGKQADVASIKGLNPQGICTDITDALRKLIRDNTTGKLYEHPTENPHFHIRMK